MSVRRKAVALAIPLVLVAACGQSDTANDRMEIKHAYSLCPKTRDAPQRLYELMATFADEQQAQIVDRSAEVQRELSAIENGKDVLQSTGADVILLTVEKPGEFRVSITNLELKEKVALTVRYGAQGVDDSRLRGLLEDVGRFWTIQRVEGGVSDIPPCNASP